ncbi:MAG TPA: hypothetical protein VHN81_08120 [Edaphobacter sp.]|nr:hypothetical protein [Edaphobacter sp.]
MPIATHFLDVHYADQRSAVVMEANLLEDLSLRSASLIFDGQSFLPFENETKFRCRLRIAFATTDRTRLVAALATMESQIHEPSFEVQLKTGKLLLKCPLATQNFQRRGGGNPVSYFGDEVALVTPGGSEVLRRWKNGDPPIWTASSYLQYWIAIRKPSQMFVKDQYEKYENKIVTSAGRPESNRRRF